MDNKYSKTMTKLMRKQPNPISHAIFILIMALLIAGVILGVDSSKEKQQSRIEEMPEFDTRNEVPVYSKLQPVYLFQEFASSNNDSIYYCYAFNEVLQPYIIAVRKEDMNQYQELIDYTISEDADIAAPATVTLKGMPVKLEQDMVEIAVEAYNAFWGSEIITTKDYKDTIGEYYLDTTQEPPAESGLLIFCIVFLLITLITYLTYLKYAMRRNKVRLATLNRIGEVTLQEINWELSEPSTFCMKGQKLFITRKYIVSSAQGFDIIPLGEITHIYGRAYGGFMEGRRYAVVAETMDGVQHEFAMVKYSQNWGTVYDSVVENIKERLPEITYGFENSFFAPRTPKFDVEVDHAQDTEKTGSNVILGILGAILGALIGSVIWIIIGKLGFIAGIAGYFMMYFAIRGYRMLSGFLDKKGQIIAVVIAFLMIFAANYTQYVMEYLKYYYNNQYTIRNLMDAYKTLPDLLQSADIWGDFIKDLVVGYLLSIWASFGILRSIFTKRQ